MGCNQARSDLIYEEQVVRECEAKLNFKSVSLIDFTFRKFSFNRVVNHLQFEEAAKEIGLTPNTKFYEDLFNLGEVELKKLLVLGVILGKGEDYQKAVLLFQVYDHSNSYEISSADVADLLETVAQLFTKNVATVIGSRPGIATYLDNCYSMKDPGNKALCRRIMKNQTAISRDDFCDFFIEKRLLSSSGIRNFYHKLTI